MKLYCVNPLPPNKRMLPADIAEYFGVSVKTIYRKSSVKEKGKKMTQPMERHYLKYHNRFWISSNDANKCFFDTL